VLSQVMFGNADSQAALDEALRSPLLAPVDKRLCTELVYGALRRYISLKAFAEQFLRRPDKLPAEMRLTLLLALYEMQYLRIPHHACVGRAVNHVRNRFGQRLAGVANGALRAMQRALAEQAHAQAADSSECADAQQLSRLFAMPLWIVQLWLRSYGVQSTRILLNAALHPAPSGLRLNRAHADWEQAKKTLVQRYGPFLVDSCALAFAGVLPWEARELLREGKACRQSAAANEALAVFSPDSWQLPIWDCCAGRGGKTLALLEQGIAVELASDQSQQRLRALPEEYARLGLRHPPCPTLLPLAVDKADAYLREQASPPRFGTILVDAPCSGLGTLSRRPEIRFRRTQEDLDTLAHLQKNILNRLWNCLKPGGSLVYLTCTLNPAENHLQIADFLATHSNAELLQEFQTDFTSPLREFFYGARMRHSGKNSVDIF
jgi:16S rRNA (cytosine967-C5)-methyltransferase